MMIAPESFNIYPVRVVLRMRSRAKLHAHHAGLLYALLAHAHAQAEAAEPVVPDGLVLEAPEQARMFLEPGEPYAFGFRMLSTDPKLARERIRSLLRGLHMVGSKAHQNGAVFGGNFELEEATGLAGEEGSHEVTPLPIPRPHIDAEIERMAGHKEVTLHFTSPLRVKRPSAARTKGRTFVDAGFFNPGHFLRRLGARLTGLGFTGVPDPRDESGFGMLENDLVWLDFTYGVEGERKALGGAVGKVAIRLEDARFIPLLVRGQYVNAGRGTRFGFGTYRIEELGPNPFLCERAVSLLERAMNSPLLDRAAAEHDLPSGRLRHLADTVLSGAYEPSPPRHVEIPKADGATRLLSIPALEDQVLQQAVASAIGPPLRRFFEDSTLACRGGLGKRYGGRRIREACRTGFRWAIRCDFHRFFDSVSHVELEKRLQAYLNDEALVDVTMKWMRNGSRGAERGIPAGAPLSHALSSLFLDEFDKRIRAEEGRLIRQSDDFLILFRSEHEAARALERARLGAEALEPQLNGDVPELRRVLLGKGDTPGVQPFDVTSVDDLRLWETRRCNPSSRVSRVNPTPRG